MAIDVFKERLNYNFETGEFTWKARCRGYHLSRTMSAGTVDRKGYIIISCRGRRVFAHRLAYEWVNGEIPSGFQIDHINRNKWDNRISNLRLATNTQNHWNITKPKNNTSGVLGVSFNKQSGKWRARIHINGRQKELGQFVNLEDAKTASTRARGSLCGVFAPEKQEVTY